MLDNQGSYFIIPVFALIARLLFRISGHCRLIIFDWSLLWLNRLLSPATGKPILPCCRRWPIATA